MLNFIVNGKSGLGLGHKSIKRLMDYCLSHKVEHSIHFTNRKGHATAIARHISEFFPQDTIVAVGGDGTFHEVLNGIKDPSVTPLGFIPSGRGNDFARTAKLNRDPVGALKDILENETTFIDYIQVGDKRCINVAGTGLDIDVLQRVEGKNGKITYLISLIYCLGHFKPYRISLKVNGEEKLYECVMIGICNGGAFGGNLKISPLSKIDDGILDIIIMRMPKDGNLLKVLPKFRKGKHDALEITTHIQCTEAEIISLDNKPIELDGEIYHDLPLICKVVAGGLKTFKTY